MVAKLLPEILAPASLCFARRHSPKPGGYSLYRDCARWEFGFTCPYCLTHESDHAPRIESTALFWLEHVVTQSSDKKKKLVNKYSNIAYSCRYCNGARSAAPLIDDGIELLDPSSDPWALHFGLEDDKLVSITDRGKRTLESYRVNAKNKVEARRYRRERIKELRCLLDEQRKMIDRLQKTRSQFSRDRKHLEAHEILDAILCFRKSVANTIKDLHRFKAIPADAPRSCRCTTSQSLGLPQAIADQTWELDA